MGHIRAGIRNSDDIIAAVIGKSAELSLCVNGGQEAVWSALGARLPFSQAGALTADLATVDNFNLDE